MQVSLGHYTEAIATVKALGAQDLNFSMGLGQVNKANLARFGLSYESVFDPCANLQAGASITMSAISARQREAWRRQGTDRSLQLLLQRQFQSRLPG